MSGTSSEEELSPKNTATVVPLPVPPPSVAHPPPPPNPLAPPPPSAVKESDSSTSTEEILKPSTVLNQYLARTPAPQQQPAQRTFKITSKPMIALVGPSTGKGGTRYRTTFQSVKNPPVVTVLSKGGIPDRDRRSSISSQSSKSHPSILNDGSSSSSAVASNVKFANIEVSLMSPPRPEEADWQFDFVTHQGKCNLGRMAERSRLYFRKYGTSMPEEFINVTPEDLRAEMEELEKQRREDLLLKRKIRSMYPRADED